MKKSPRRSFTFFILIPLLIILGILIIPQIFKKINPSPDMLRLRQVEASLNIPPADFRTEHDKGCYTDGKGAPQFQRSIHFNYKNLETPIATQKKILEAGWTLSDMIDVELENHRRQQYWYINELEPDVRISISMTSDTISTSPHNMIITYTNDDQCITYPNVVRN
ncbi:MAG: hypothetical protein WAU07_03280 [Microgenomates group bacterium]